MAASGVAYPIDFNLQVKGQEQISAAQKLFDQLSQVLTSIVPQFQQLGEASARSGQQVQQSQSSLTGIINQTGQALTKEQQAFTQLDSSTSKVRTTIDQTGQAFNKVNTELAKSGQEVTKLKTSVDQTAQSETKLQTSTQALSQTFATTKTAVTGVASEMDKGKQSSTNLATAIDQAKQKTDQVKGSFDQAGNAITKTGEAAEQSSTRFSRFKESAGTLLTGISQLISTGFELEHTFAGWEKAQTGLDKANLKVEKSTEAVEKAHKKYLDTIKDTSKTQDDINNAFRDYQQALDSNSIATETLQQKQEALDTSYQSFALQTVPSMVQGLAGTVNTFQSLSKIFQGQKTDTDTLSDSTDELTDAMGWAQAGADEAAASMDDFGEAQQLAVYPSTTLVTTLKGGIQKMGDFRKEAKDTIPNVKNLGSETKETGSQAKGFFAKISDGVKDMFGFRDASDQTSVSVKNMGENTEKSGSKLMLLGRGLPVATAAVLALVAGFTLIQTNALGIRDKLSTLGDNLGRMVPQLRGPLELVEGLSGAFGISGEQADKWNAALKRGVDEVMPTLTMAGNGLREFLNALGGYFDFAIRNFHTIQDEWTSFFNAFHSTINFFTVDIPNAIKGVGDSFMKMFDALGRDPAGVLKGFFDSLVQNFSTLGDLITPELEKFGDNLKTGFEVIGKVVWEGFSQAFKTIDTWTNDNIVIPVTKTLDGLKTAFETGAKGAWEGFTSQIANVGQWFADNVSNPITDKFKSLVETAGAGGQGILTGLNTGIGDVGKWATTYILTPIGTVLTALVGGSTTAGSDAWTGLTSAWTGASQWFTDNFVNKLDAVWDTFTSGAQSAGTDAYNKLTGAWTGFTNWWNGIYQSMGSGFAKLFGAQPATPPPVVDSTATNTSAATLKQQFEQNKQNLAVQNANIGINASPTGPSSQGLTTQGDPWSVDGISGYTDAMGRYITVAGDANKAGDYFFDTLGRLLTSTKKNTEATDQSGESVVKLTAEQIKARAVQGAYTDAIKAQGNALDAAEATLMGNVGTLQTLKAQLSETKIHTTALAQGFADAATAFLNTQLQTDKLRGAILFLETTLTTAEGIMTRFNLGFEQGRKSIIDWAGGIDTAKGSAVGIKTELDNLYKQTGIQLPAGLQKSTESLKAWYEAMAQSPEAIKKTTDALQGGFMSMIQGLSDALDEGKKEFKDKIKEIEKELGFRIPKEVKTEWKLEAQTEDLKKDITQVLQFLQDPNLSQDSAKYFVDNLYQRLGEEVKHNPKLGAAANTINQLLTEYLNTSDVDAKAAILNKIMVAVQNISATANDAIPFVRDLNREFGDVRNMDNFAKAIESINEQLDALSKKDLSNLKELNNISEADADLQKKINDQRSGIQAEHDLISKSIGGSSSGVKGTATPANKQGGGSITVGKPTGGGTSAATAAAGGGTTPKSNPLAGQQDPVVIPVFIDPSTVGPQMEAIRAAINGVVANIIQDVQGLGPGIAGGFQAAAEQSAPIMESIRDGFDGMVNTLISDAQGIGPGVSSAFASARSSSQSHISGIGSDFLTQVVGKITSGMAGLGQNVVAQFESMRAGIIGKFNAIGTAAQNTFNQILGYVRAVTAEIKSVPTDINVVYHVSVVGDKPPSAAAAGFQGIVTGSHVMTVGEAGPELVSVIPLKNSKLTAGGGHSFAAEGFQGIVGADAAAAHTSPSIIQPSGNSAGGLMDVRIVSIGPNSPVNAMLPVVIVGSTIGGIGGGSSTGGGNTTSTGGIGSGSGTSTQTSTQTNTGTSTNTSTSSGTGGGGVTTGTYTKPSYVKESGSGSKWQGQNMDPKSWVSTEMTDPDKKGLFKVVDDKGQNIATEFKTKGEADQYIAAKRGIGSSASGTTTPTPTTGSGTSGTSTGSQTTTPTTTGGDPYNNNNDTNGYNFSNVQVHGTGSKWEEPSAGSPDDWQIVKMADDPSKFKIIDKKTNKNVAANFNSEQQATNWIANYKNGGSPPTSNTTTSGTTTTPTPTNTSGQVPTSSGGATATAGSTSSGIPYYAGKPSGQYGYNADAKVTLKDGSQMNLLDWNNQPASTRKSRMNDIKTLPKDYALYEDGSINRSPDWGQTPSSTTTGGGSNNTATSPQPTDTTGQVPGSTSGSGTNTGTVTGDKNTLGPGGEGYYKTWSGYNVPGYIQTVGHGANDPSKWSQNPDPNTWTAKPMVDPSSQGLWKVVDDKGLNIAAKFKSEAEANEFIQEHRFAYHGNTGTGTGTPTTGGSTSGTPTTGGGSSDTTTTNPPSGTTTGGGSGVGQTTGGNENFTYQTNGHELVIQQGKIVTNTLSAAEYAQADVYYFQTNKRHLPSFGSGSGTGSGTSSTGTGGSNGSGNQGTVEDNFDDSNSGRVQQNFPGLGVTTGAGNGNPSTAQPDGYTEFTSGGKKYFWSRQGGVVTSNAPASVLAAQGLPSPNAYGGVIPDPFGSGGIMGGGSGTGTGTQTSTQTSTIVDGPNALVKMGDMIVDGKNGIVIMGNQVVNGKTGTVTTTSGSSPLLGSGFNVGGMLGIGGQSRSPIGAPTVVGTIGMPSGTTTTGGSVGSVGGGNGTDIAFTDANGNNYHFQQSVNQTSNVQSGSGQSINSGQNLYYQNQNGKINTNMNSSQLSQWLGMFGLGGGGSGSGSGDWNGVGVRPEPTFEQLRTGMDNTVPMYDVGPVNEGADFGTQLFRTGGLGSIGGGGGFGGIPGLGKFPFGEIIHVLLERITEGLKALNLNINLDGQPIYNSMSNDLIKRYNSQF